VELRGREFDNEEEFNAYLSLLEWIEEVGRRNWRMKKEGALEFPMDNVGF
jgi:hypothetical protein